MPKADGHRREMAGTDQFAFLADDPLAGVVPDLDGHAQALALHFAPAHWQYRVAGHEAGHDVRAAGHG
ncbi:hypothetical protein D3C72_2300410 [compost metagenome]